MMDRNIEARIKRIRSSVDPQISNNLGHENFRKKASAKQYFQFPGHSELKQRVHTSKFG